MSILEEMMQNVPKEHRWGAVLGHFFNSLEEVRKNTDAGGRIPVDMWQSESIGNIAGATTLTPPKVVDVPIVITNILATWAANALDVSQESPVGDVTNPGAGTLITSIANVPAGQYLAYFLTGYAGSVTAADLDNMQFEINGVVQDVLISNVVSAASAQNPWTPGQEITVPNNATVSINATAASSGASAQYRAQIRLVAVQPVESVVITIGKRVMSLDPGQGAFTADTMIQFDNWDDPICMVVTPGSPCHFEIMGYADKRVIDK